MQRIQTLYLLTATILMVIFACSTLSTFTTPEGIFDLTVWGINSIEGVKIYDTLYLIIITSLSTLLPLANIFLFKKRMLQIRLCIVEIILLVGTLLIGGLYHYLANRFFGSVTTEGVSSTIRIVGILPLVAIYFSYLAFGSTLKDELLIKSLNRIR